MSRAEGDGNRRHYHVVRDGHAEHQPRQQWRLVWAEIAKRARLDHDVAWRVQTCPPSGCRFHVIR